MSIVDDFNFDFDSLIVAKIEMNFYSLLVVKDMIQKPAGQPIVVGTTGKLIQMFQSRGKKAALSAKHIKMLVLDEADQLIDQQGQLTQTKKIKKELPKSCQVLLFSATYSDEVGAFATSFVPQPRVEIRLKRQELSLEKVAQFYIHCDTEANKFNVLDEIYGHLGTGKVLFFDCSYLHLSISNPLFLASFKLFQHYQ